MLNFCSFENSGWMWHADNAKIYLSFRSWKCNLHILCILKRVSLNNEERKITRIMIYIELIFFYSTSHISKCSRRIIALQPVPNISFPTTVANWKSSFVQIFIVLKILKLYYDDFIYYAVSSRILFNCYSNSLRRNMMAIFTLSNLILIFDYEFGLVSAM